MLLLTFALKEKICGRKKLVYLYFDTFCLRNCRSFYGWLNIVAQELRLDWLMRTGLNIFNSL